jgi:hypothetical protein
MSNLRGGVPDSSRASKDYSFTNILESAYWLILKWKESDGMRGSVEVMDGNKDNPLPG